MTLTDAITIVSVAFASVGGASAIIIWLSAWLGKVWANRLMASETAKHAKDIEALKSQLQTALDKSSQAYRQKLDLYLKIADPLVDLLIELEQTGQCKPDTMTIFERKRLNMAATLGMFASNAVFNAYNDLIDYMLDALEGKHTHGFSEFRKRALRLFTEVRHDIGLHNDQLDYTGSR